MADRDFQQARAYIDESNDQETPGNEVVFLLASIAHSLLALAEETALIRRHLQGEPDTSVTPFPPRQGR